MHDVLVQRSPTPRQARRFALVCFAGGPVEAQVALLLAPPPTSSPHHTTLAHPFHSNVAQDGLHLPMGCVWRACNDGLCSLTIAPCHARHSRNRRVSHTTRLTPCDADHSPCFHPSSIASTFSKDLLLEPSSRDVSDVQHTITAVASSTSKQRAQDFISDVGADKQRDGTVARAYGNYEEFALDGDVDIVYVATPHSHHYENVLTCLEAGKNVCCEVRLARRESSTRSLLTLAPAEIIHRQRSTGKAPHQARQGKGACRRRQRG